jgi:Zn-dependent protease with chaperone function
MLAAAGRPGGFVHRLERFHPRLIVLAFLVVVALGAGLRWGLPAIADAAARATPVDVLQTMGRGALATLDRIFLDPSALPAWQQDEIAAAFAELVRNADLGADATLSFRTSPAFGANAFALPGAQIFITDQLVDLAGTPEMVAAVLAHEIAHAELRHPARMVYRAGGLSLALVLIAGDAGSLIEESLGLGIFALQNGYSRSFEQAADDRASQLLGAAGRDPKDLAAMLSLLVRDCGQACDGGGWFSTHPAVADRIARLTGR